MELKQYAAILWRWAWLIALGTVAGAGIALAVSLYMQPVYRASATLLVSEAQNADSSNYNDILTSERLARTYSELLTKRAVLDEVIRRLSLPTDAESLADQIDIELVRDTRLIVVNVEDRNPLVAATVANLVPAVFSEQNRALQSRRYASARESLEAEMADLQTQLDQTQAAIDALDANRTQTQTAEYTRLQVELVQARQTYANLRQSYEALQVAEVQSSDDLLVFEPAQPPAKPARPRVALNTILAGAVGLIVAVGVALLVEYLDDSFKSPEQVSQELSLPVLGAVARLPGSAGEGKLAALTEPRSPSTEAFRAVRTSIRFSSVDRPLKTLLITSPGPGEGKTTLAANLAVVMAQAGLRVVLVDCDLRRPAVHHLFGGATGHGLTDVMLQPANGLGNVLRATDLPALHLLPAGPPPPNPAELLGSERMQSLIEALRAKVDVVVIDSPPLLPVTDAAVLASRVDGVVLVVDGGRTRVMAARQAQAILERVGAKVVGVVINRIPARDGYGYYYQNYHYHHRPSSNGHRSPNGRNVFSWRYLRRKLLPERAAQPEAEK